METLQLSTSIEVLIPELQQALARYLQPPKEQAICKIDLNCRKNSIILLDVRYRILYKGKLKFSFEVEDYSKDRTHYGISRFIAFLRKPEPNKTVIAGLGGPWGFQLEVSFDSPYITISQSMGYMHAYYLEKKKYAQAFIQIFEHYQAHTFVDP